MAVMQLGLTPEQLVERRNGIGGSDAAKIMGGLWHELWLDKTGRSEPEDLSRDLAVQMGSFTEPLNIFWFERETGHKVFGRGEVYRHPDYDFIRCTLDGLALIDSRPAIIQAKHVSAFAKIEEIEQRYYPQVAHEMLVTGSSLAFLSVFLGTQKYECIEIQRDREYTTRLLEYEQEFWNYVVKDEPPPQAEAVPTPARPALFRTVDMSASNIWCDLAVDWLENQAAAKKHDKAAKELRGMVEADVGMAFGKGVAIKRSKDGKLFIGAAK
jgi:predicted phage-related endonuclease